MEARGALDIVCARRTLELTDTAHSHRAQVAASTIADAFCLRADHRRHIQRFYAAQGISPMPTNYLVLGKPLMKTIAAVHENGLEYNPTSAVAGAVVRPIVCAKKSK